MNMSRSSDGQFGQSVTPGQPHQNGTTVRKGGRKKLSRVCPYCNKVFTRHNKLTAHINERRCRRPLASNAGITVGSHAVHEVQTIKPSDLTPEVPVEGLTIQVPCENSIVIYSGRPDPDINETRHILECSSCWQKLTTDVFSPKWWNNALIQALKYNNPALINHLINFGADPEYIDGTHTVFQHAVLKGCDLRIVKTLCDQGVNPDQLVEEICGDTALHIACSDPNQIDSSSISYIFSLLDSNASADIQNARMELPIHNFLFTCPKTLDGRRDVLEALIARTNKNGQYLNHQNFEGCTPLHLAALYCPEAIPLLLKYQADPNIKNKDGFYPIHLTSSPECLSDLSDSTRGGLRAVNDAGLTLLHIASFRGDFPVVRRILELDKRMVHLRNQAGRTGLLIALDSNATLENRLATARTFLDFGADVNVHDAERNTALHLAIANLRIQLDWASVVNDGPAMSEFVRLVVDKGAKVSHQNSKGKTPLGLLLQNFLRIKDVFWEVECRMDIIRHPRHASVPTNDPKEELKKVESQRSNLITEMGELMKFITVLRSQDAVISQTELEQLSPLLHQSYLLGNAVVAILNSAITLY